ncbi:probetacellulin [Kogia breviceps]|uniref:probetacellulin n=1 Tax=Kogia breviceps TaxID=27615 RepID=UPI0034D30FEC
MDRRVNGEIKNISDILKVALGEPTLPDIQQIMCGKEKLGNCQMPEGNHSHHDEVLRLVDGVCAERARINRRLPVPGDTRVAGRPPARGVRPPGSRVPAWGVVSLLASSGIRFQAPRRAPVAREGGAGGGGRLVSGLLGPAAGLMARAAPGSGASSLPLLLALALGLVILHCVVADGNSTRSPENDGLLCGDRGENCPATTTQPKRRGHFSRCPKQYKHYCIKGRCRFVVAEQTPSCVCDEGFAGARCERVDLFYLRGDRGQILVICLIAVMVIFIILVVGVCTCCHPLLKHRERIKKEEEMETLVYDDTSRLVASYKTPYSFENGQTVSQENS